MQKGKLTVIYGCMFAGKTTKLIEDVNALLAKGIKVAVFHPVIDTRYKLNAIAAHNGESHESQALDLDIKHIEKDGYKAVALDEMNFFSDSVIIAIKELLKAGIDVYVAGLDNNYLGEPFPVVQKLMDMADEKIELFAKCNICGKPAMYTFRTVKNDALIVVGGTDMYEARCKEHFKYE